MLDPSLIKTKTLERAAKEVSKAKVRLHNESLVTLDTASHFIMCSVQYHQYLNSTARSQNTTLKINSVKLYTWYQQLKFLMDGRLTKSNDEEAGVITSFIKSILISLVFLAIWLALSSAIYSQIFCSKSDLFLSQWEWDSITKQPNRF